MQSNDNTQISTNHREIVGRIAVTLNELLRLRGKTAGDLARQTGVHAASISALRNAKNPNPGLGSLIRLAEALDVPLSDFFPPTPEAQAESLIPRFLTYSEWIWKTFVHLMGVSVLNEPEERLRTRFEAFIMAVRPEHRFSQEDIEAIWRDRKVFAGTEDQETDGSQ